MKINIRYFGKLTDITNCTEEVIFAQDESLLKDTVDDLYEKHPELKKSTYVIFVNSKKADFENSILNHNDEIVLMPPFSGG